MPRRKIDVAIARELYQSGARLADIADLFGASSQCVGKALRRAGTQIRPPNRGSAPKFGPSIQAEVVRAYESGFTQTTVAAQFGMSQGNVQKILAKHGVNTRPHGLRNQSIKIPTNPTILAYTAGLFDGEGNLQLRNKHGGHSIAWKLAIYNTEPAVMSWLERIFGVKAKWRKRSHGWKTMGNWEVYRARDVAALLKAMLPYLIIKRPQAEATLDSLSSHFTI